MALWYSVACGIRYASFPFQESETGLYVCMNTFRGFGKEHVERHFRKTGNAVFLHMRRIVKEVSKYVMFCSYL